MEDYKVRQTGPEVQEALDQTTINKNDIAGINGKLPEEASPENPLADKAYVDDKVTTEKTRAEVRRVHFRPLSTARRKPVSRLMVCSMARLLPRRHAPRVPRVLCKHSFSR
jgi:hypothetical protein